MSDPVVDKIVKKLYGDDESNNQNVITDSQLELCKTAVEAMVQYFEHEAEGDWQWGNSRVFFQEQAAKWKKLQDELSEL